MLVPAQDSMWRSDGRRKQFTVYIVSNDSMTLYIGVTSDIEKRAREHFAGVGARFTKRYHFDTLVYLEVFELAHDAFARETQLKGWRREKKIALIKSVNPSWSNLLDHFAGPAGKQSS